ncbi:MAG: amino acid racemase [Steroidobacteraceae bacterium]
MSRPLHIGIVGCSYEGAALCYRTICSEAQSVLGAHAHPPVSMHTLPLADYVACLDSSDLEGVAALMLDSAERLARCGADFLVCPDNTIHQAMHLVQPKSPLHWLHIARVVTEEASNRGFRTLGLTGTQWLVRSEAYPQACAAAGLTCIRPTDEQRDRMGQLIMGELVHGVFKDPTVRFFQSVIESFRATGCDAVILGCTEIPLIINDGNSVLPTLDSTRLLARAAIRHACGTTSEGHRRSLAP